MALADFLYRCPCCGADPLRSVGKTEARCTESCGRSFRLAHGGGRIVVQHDAGEEEVSLAALGRALGRLGGAVSSAEGDGGVLRREARVRVRIASAEAPVRFRGHLLGYFERFGSSVEGKLRLEGDLVSFEPCPRAGAEGGGTAPNARESGPEAGGAGMMRWPVSAIRALQGSSSSLQISPAEGGVIQFRFPDDSPRRWEELFEEALRRSWRARGLGEIAEFQPRIRVRRQRPAERGQRRAAGRRPGRCRGHGGKRTPGGDSRPVWAPARTSLVYRILRGPSRWILRAIARIEVEGRENVPPRGPFVLVPNHQSLADPFLVQAFTGRIVHSMTKSTQFDSAFFRWLLPRLHGFPVRRYRVDPQAVRVLLRLLEEGRGVCIYPEGERTWDGQLQPFRRGALRVLLRAGVPIVPVGIHGMTDLWPRWLRLPRPTWRPRVRVNLRFGAPIELPEVLDRAERERRIPELDRLLHERIRALSDAGAPKADPVAPEADSIAPEAPRDGLDRR